MNLCLKRFQLSAKLPVNCIGVGGLSLFMTENRNSVNFSYIIMLLISLLVNRFQCSLALAVVTLAAAARCPRSCKLASSTTHVTCGGMLHFRRGHLQSNCFLCLVIATTNLTPCYVCSLYNDKLGRMFNEHILQLNSMFSHSLPHRLACWVT